MTSALAPLAAGLLLAAASASAQEAGSAAQSGTAASQAPAAGQQGAIQPAKPPKGQKGLLLDVVKALVPPLIDAATSTPKPRPAEPVAGPALATPPPAEPVAAAPIPVPSPAQPVAVIQPMPRPTPIPPDIKAEPKPTVPGPAAVSAPNSGEPAGAPAVQLKTKVEQPAGTLPAEAAKSAPGPTAAPVPAPPVASEQARTTRAGILWPLLGFLALIAAAATALRLRRVRQVARTRAALSLQPSLDSSFGACSASGLSMVAPPLTIHARLQLQPGHG